LYDESAAKAGFSRFGNGPGASKIGSALGEDEESEPDDPRSMSDFSLTVGLAELPACVEAGLCSSVNFIDTVDSMDVGADVIW